jgi:hypothetical protein
MSKKQSSTEAVKVRALKDDASHGLVAGLVATVAADLIEPLKAAGLIDDHPDAVAYAQSVGADVVESA